MRTIFNKHKYLRVIKFNTDKSSRITYHLSETFKAPFIINPDHVFIANGYRTVLITDKSAETINPLNFQSKYNVNDFQTAIESKIIHDTFASITKSPFDLVTLLLIVNILIGVVLAYLILKGQGAI